MTEALLLFCAAFVAAAISGAAGFGGALLLLPLLAASVGAAHAVPLLTVAQLIGNLARAGFGFQQIRWRPVAWFLLGALPASVAGAFSFVELPKDIAVRLIGGVILLFIALKYLGGIKFDPRPRWLVAGGALTGFLSGLVGSAGPLGATIFLSLGLPPVAYVASEAVTALAMHGMKMVVYQQYIALDQAFWQLAGLLGIAMILGTWLARRVIELIPRETFQRYVAGLLAAIALYMLLHG